MQVLCSVPDMGEADTQVEPFTWSPFTNFSPDHLATGPAPHLSAPVLQAAIDAAHEAFQTWQHTTAKERSPTHPPFPFPDPLAP